MARPILLSAALTACLAGCALHPVPRVNAPAQTTAWQVPVEGAEEGVVQDEELSEDVLAQGDAAERQPIQEGVDQEGAQGDAGPPETIDPDWVEAEAPKAAEASLKTEAEAEATPVVAGDVADPTVPPADAGTTAPQIAEEPEAVGSPSDVAEATQEVAPRSLEIASLLDTALLGPEGEELGSVADLLMEPSEGRVLGLLASPVESTTGAFLPLETVASYDPAGVVLTAEGRELLRAERRDLRLAELFRGRELEACEGSIAELGPVEEGEDLLSLLLTDANNQRHRVFLAPASVVSTIPLEEGGAARIQALRTRDETGPLLIASWISVQDVEVPLRDEQGRASWSRERPAGWLLHGVLERLVRVEGESVGTILELYAASDDGSLQSVSVGTPEFSVSLSWSDLQSEEGKGLSVAPELWAQVVPQSPQ